MPTRWFNQRLPQTLVMSQFLLYFNAFWAALGVLFGGGLGLLGLLVLGGTIYAAAGIASEKKLGYRVAVVVAFLPFALRILIAIADSDGLLDNIGYVLVGANLVNALFEYALIVLLLHSQSREHQKIWFD